MLVFACTDPVSVPDKPVPVCLDMPYPATPLRFAIDSTLVIANSAPPFFSATGIRAYDPEPASPGGIRITDSLITQSPYPGDNGLTTDTLIRSRLVVPEPLSLPGSLDSFWIALSVIADPLALKGCLPDSAGNSTQNLYDGFFVYRTGYRIAGDSLVINLSFAGNREGWEYRYLYGLKTGLRSRATSRYENRMESRWQANLRRL